MSNPEVSKFKIMADGLKARSTFSKLMAEQRSNAQFLDREMESSMVKIAFKPPYKAILQDVAADRRENMADFIRTAVHERLERLLNAQIVAMERLEAAEKEAA